MLMPGREGFVPVHRGGCVCGVCVWRVTQAEPVWLQGFQRELL